MYLPKSWTSDPARLTATHVPEFVNFATKPALAVQIIQRTLAADVPFSWVAANAVYGVGDVEQALRRACKGYVLGVKSDHYFGSWAGKAEEIAQDWAYCELADLEADEYDETKSGVWTRGLLIRRNISDGDLAYFTTWCPAGTEIQALVSVEGRRRAIEDSFETTKNELGLDHNESRSMMAVIRYRTNDVTPPKRSRMRTIGI